MAGKRGRTTSASRGAAAPDPTPTDSDGGRITYRELRNTPGRVWERLAEGQPVTLFADGEAKALVIPVRDGNASGAMEAYRRGRALMALDRVQAAARESGKDKLTLAEINKVIRDVRRERNACAVGG